MTLATSLVPLSNAAHQSVRGDRPAGCSAAESADPEAHGAPCHEHDGTSASPSWLDKLNDAQRRAARHGIDSAAAGDEALGPLLIVAGAGTGKTNTLAHRVVNLLLHGVAPQRILLLTFSRRAAVEMTRRVARVLNATRTQLEAEGSGRPALPPASGAILPWAGTFHAVGARLLRDYASLVGLSPAFTISDREDAADLMNLVRHQLGLSIKAKRFPTKQTCLSIYSRVVNTESPLRDVLTAQFPWCVEWEASLRQLFAAYTEAKLAQSVLDYDDLLLYWAHLAADPTIAADLGHRFDHILIDEYQDTNRLQATVMKRMKPDGAGVTVVGDDAQSIYAFRGATVRNILEFPSTFSTTATTITLEQNYRSLQPILDASNAVIGLAPERFTKALWSDRAGDERPRIISVPDESEQAGYVCSRVLENRERGMRLKQHAVLFRAAHHSAALEIELTRRNVPFVKFGGLKFLDASHVKDLLAVLRWLQNPRDRVAGFRVLQLLPGIGPASATQIQAAVEAACGSAATAEDAAAPAAGSALDVWSRVPAGTRAGSAWTDFIAMVADAGDGDGTADGGAWPASFDRIRAWYSPLLALLHEETVSREADLDQLARIAATYPSRERFLTELTLDPPQAVSDAAGVPLKDEDYMILSTIHSSKGQEWSTVFILNAVDGCLPSDLGTGSHPEIEEERRLLYVAMTRAKNTLEIVVPQRFYVQYQPANGDRYVHASRTRFIPPKLLKYFDQTVWPRPAAASEQGSRALSAVKLDIATKLRGLWTP